MKDEINVLVSGGGVAKLSTAYWLARYCVNVAVIELAPQPHPGGQERDVRPSAGSRKANGNPRQTSGTQHQADRMSSVDAEWARQDPTEPFLFHEIELDDVNRSTSTWGLCRDVAMREAGQIQARRENCPILRRANRILRAPGEEIVRKSAH